MCWWQTDCYAVGLLDVEDEILNKGHLIKTEDELQPSGYHLGQGEEEDGGGIDLEVPPAEVPHHCGTCACRGEAVRAEGRWRGHRAEGRRRSTCNTRYERGGNWNNVSCTMD